MDDETAKTLNATTQLLPGDYPQGIEDPALSDPNLPLGEDGTGGVWETKAKTFEQEREETKRENEGIRTKLQEGIKLTDKKYLPKAATKLSKVAPRIFAAVRANPPDWLDEADRFISQTIGKCPSHTVRAQAANEWDAAAMAILLSFGYFAELLKEMDDADQAARAEALPALEGSAGGDSSGPVADTTGVVDGEGAAVVVTEGLATAEVEEPVPNMAQRSSILDAAGQLSDAFTILGPDGQPVIEKLR